MASGEHETMASIRMAMFVLGVFAVVAAGRGGATAQAQQANPGDADGAKELTLDLDNKMTMKLVQIPAGKFLMGSPETEKDRGKDEAQHEVTITKPFYMGKYEVTQEQWMAVMGTNPSRFKGEANHPVESVTWDECQKFCQQLSEKTGKTVRLPTEAEWEYACRAGGNGRYNFGDSDELLGWYAWYGEDGGHRPVGQKKPNAWGLYDMHGNIAEWCQDWYAPIPAAGDAIDPTGPSRGTQPVSRGGSWVHVQGNCRAAARDKNNPASRSRFVGLRVVVGADGWVDRLLPTPIVSDTNPQPRMLATNTVNRTDDQKVSPTVRDAPRHTGETVSAPRPEEPAARSRLAPARLSESSAPSSARTQPSSMPAAEPHLAFHLTGTRARVVNNPDNAPISVTLLSPRNALRLPDFQVGWESGSASLSALAFGNDSVFVNRTALVVEWAVEPNLEIASMAAKPYLMPLDRVGHPTQGGERHFAPVVCLAGLEAAFATRKDTGEISRVVAKREGVAGFLWFVPDTARDVRLCLPRCKAIQLALPELNVRSGEQAGRSETTKADQVARGEAAGITSRAAAIQQRLVGSWKCDRSDGKSGVVMTLDDQWRMPRWNLILGRGLGTITKTTCDEGKVYYLLDLSGPHPVVRTTCVSDYGLEFKKEYEIVELGDRQMRVREVAYAKPDLQEYVRVSE